MGKELYRAVEPLHSYQVALTISMFDDWSQIAQGSHDTAGMDLDFGLQNDDHSGGSKHQCIFRRTVISFGVYVDHA